MDLRTLRRIAKRGWPRARPRIARHAGAPDVVVACNEHGAYCLPRAVLHRPACQAILRGEIWEARTLAFLAANAGGGDIVHAGAFFGDFLPALSRAAAPGAKVWAFEALDDNWRCAAATVALNGLVNVDLRHAALGDGDGELRLRTRDKDGLLLGGATHVAADGEATAPQLRLDDAIPADRPVSLLQLDVERHEAAALAGGAALLRRWRPLVVLETTPPDFAGEFGYVFDRRLGPNQVWRPAERVQVA